MTWPPEFRSLSRLWLDLNLVDICLGSHIADFVEIIEHFVKILEINYLKWPKFGGLKVINFPIGD